MGKKKIYVGHAQLFDISGRKEKGATLTINLEDLGTAFGDTDIDTIQTFKLLVLPRKAENVTDEITHSVKLVIDV